MHIDQTRSINVDIPELQRPSKRRKTQDIKDDDPIPDEGAPADVSREIGSGPEMHVRF
jgi:hypothetical protein